MLLTAGPIFSIKADEIANVVRENGALLAGRIVKLLGIRPAGALQVQDVDRFIAPLSKDLGEQRRTSSSSSRLI